MGYDLHICTEFKVVSFFLQQLIAGPKISISDHYDLGHGHLGVVFFSIRRWGPLSVSVKNLKHIAQFL